MAQAILVALEKRDIGADRHRAAVPGPALVDLQPAFVGKLNLGGAGETAAIRIRDATLDHRACRCCIDGSTFGSRHQHTFRQSVSLLEVGVAHHETVVLVPQHEGFGRAFDRVSEALIGLGITLCQTVLFGDVHGDADHVDTTGSVANDLCPCAHPDIMSRRVAHAEYLVDLLGIAAADGTRESVDITVRRMHHPCGIGKRDDAAGSRQAKHFVHRTGPEEPAVGNIEIPKSATPMRQCGFDP
ncbi:hypothetical protein D3C73_804040 [compost metagenome]